MQQRDNYKTVDDFLADESFQRWIRQQGDSQNWEAWTVENPQRARLVQQARLWVLAMRVPEADLTQAETQAALQQTWQKIRRMEEPSVPVVRLWANRWWQSAAAAILVVGLGLAWLYQRQIAPVNSRLTYTELVRQNPKGLIEQVNNTDKPQLITLSDGSSILLEPRSKLSYPTSFDLAERRVYLSGEGFFEISKNPRRPFLVLANEVVTKVIGTSFRVKAYTDQPNVEVTVRTGKVSVSSNQQIATSANKGMLLLPNEGVRFLRQTLAFEKMTDSDPEELLAPAPNSIEQLSFEFTDAPVARILKTLEQAYQVEIDYPAHKLKDCYLTTSLSDQPLPEKLKIICESLGNNTRYEMNGNHISIISEGCN